MKFLLLLCALSIVFENVYGALSISPADPKYPGHCYTEKTGLMDYNEQKTIQDCVEATCNADGTIQFAGCGAIGNSCGKTIEDLTKPYPDCCPIPAIC
ncbi:hypothetical protein NQ315_004651 [Exocentrus adspersus]|uniref:Single domain-containing protein n=1 Tax=Exocentrus adspersus TaxID=1586481 RepID=A0AAV8VNL6_9CUCU|nr:hypothetical protein NQ315_004651 [Exocentrus adspersus]